MSMAQSDYPQRRFFDRDMVTFHGVRVPTNKVTAVVGVLRRETDVPAYWLDLLEQDWVGAQELDSDTASRLEVVIESALWKLGLDTRLIDGLVIYDYVTWKLFDAGDRIDFTPSNNRLLRNIAAATDNPTTDFSLSFHDWVRLERHL